MSALEFTLNIAVIIGINNYQHGIQSLGTARQDAEAIAEILERDYEYEVHLITDSEATSDNIIQWLETALPEKMKTANSSRFLFYFAGHGIALNGEDGPEGYLIPQEARLGDVSTYLPMSKVYEALIKLSCRHFLGILDCCFAGAFRWSSTRKLVPVELGTIHKERFDRFIQDPAWQVITSAAHDQTASDSFNLKDDRGQKGRHSPFAAALIDALQGKADAYPVAEPDKPAGDGVITATELYLYLRGRVEVETEARSLRQTPGMYPLKKHDKGEYIFLTPGHPLNLPPAPPLDVSSNPYRGLESFDEEHKDLFFGRKALTQQLAEFVPSHALTVVLGASGSGKSSLAKAGLIPTLRQMPDWYFLSPFRPGESPSNAWKQALTNLPTATDGLVFPDAQASSLDLLTPTQVLSHWFEEHPQTHLLMVVDQLEELITLCRDEQERQQFLDMLAEAIVSHPNQLHLVLTLRSDFESQFRNTALEESWQTARFVVPAMTREELRQAIEEPASAKVMYFAPHELVDQLIDEVANMPGALPLLSFALSELYLKYLERQGKAKNRGETLDRAITQADYDELGGVTRSLTQRAEREYGALVQEDPAYEHTIRNVMLRMVSVGGELARRRVLRSELTYPEPENGRVQRAIKGFDAARLLTSGTDTENCPYIEPAHDVLVRGWQRLLEWRQHDLANLVLQRELYPRAEQWRKDQSNKASIGLLWNTDPRLPQLRQLLNVEHSWLNETEIEFVKRSSQRKTNNQRRLVSSLVTVFLALSGLTVFAFVLQGLATQSAKEATTQRDEANRQRDEATRQKNEAETQRKEANRQRNEAVASQKEAKRQAGIALTNQKKAEDNQREAKRQADIALTNQKKAEDNQREATKQAGIALTNQKRAETNQKLAEYQATVAQLREQSARVLNWLPTSRALVLAIATVDQSQKEAEQDTLSAATSSLLTAVQTVQEQNLLQGHESTVYSAIFSPDGSLIASSSYDNTVRLWDAKTGQPIGDPLRGHEGSVYSVAFSPDGRYIVSGSGDATLRLWDVQTGQPVGSPFRGHKYNINSVAFSPDGSRIVSGGYDKTVRLWDARTSQPIGMPLEGHQSPIWSVAFSPDGRYIASGSGSTQSNPDNSVRLWDAQTGEPVGQPLQGHSGTVNSVAFSPDGKLIVSGGQDTIRLWNAQTRQLEQILPSNAKSVTFSQDSRHIASTKDVSNFGIDNAIYVWDVQTGRSIGQPLLGHSGKIESVAFSPDDNRIVSSSEDNTVRLWDARIGQPHGRILYEHQGIVRAVAISPDGNFVASGGGELNDDLKIDDNTIRLLNTQTGQLNLLQGHTGSIWALVFSPDSRHMISSSSDGTVRLWDTQTGQFIGNLEHGESFWFSIHSLAFSPDGQRIVGGSRDGPLYLWDIQTRQLIHQRFQIDTPFQGHSDPVNSVAFSPDGFSIVSSSYDDTVRLWNAQTGQLKTTLQGKVSSVVFSPDGRRIIGGTKNTILQWDSNTGNPIGQPLQGHLATVTTIVSSPDGHRIISGSVDGTIWLWDAQTGQPIGRPLEGHTGAINSIALSLDGKYILSGSEDNSVRLWDADWSSWIELACNRLKYHPFLNKPDTITSDTELLQTAQRARSVCNERVWQQQLAPNGIPLSWVEQTFPPMIAREIRVIQESLQ